MLAVSSILSKRLGTPGKRGFGASDVGGLKSRFLSLLKRLALVKGGAGFVLALSSVFPKRLGTPEKRVFGPSAVGFPKREAPVLCAESVVACVFLKRLLGAFPVGLVVS